MLIIVTVAVVGNNIHTPWIKLAILGPQDVSRLELEGSGLRYSLGVEVMNENEGIECLISGVNILKEQVRVWT